MNNEMIIFIVVQFINVIISTFKSVLTIKGNKFTAALVNSISYTFGAVITKLITKQSFEVVIIVTFFANLIGVFIAKWILEKREPVKLWVYQVTIRDNEIKEIQDQLLKRNIKYTAVEALNDRNSVSIYSYSKLESTIVREILKDHYYTVLESK